jgi:hypothetical protein
MQHNLLNVNTAVLCNATHFGFVLLYNPQGIYSLRRCFYVIIEGILNPI